MDKIKENKLFNEYLTLVSDCNHDFQLEQKDDTFFITYIRNIFKSYIPTDCDDFESAVNCFAMFVTGFTFNKR